MRTIDHCYQDPLDAIWLVTAHRIGLRVERSGQVYASTDGRGRLLVGEARTLDPDDSLAQMVFHELCHSLIEGPDAFDRPDWGLDNTGPRDIARERACLRLQATLAAEYGLRGFLAPTTEFRSFYDELASDPLQPRRDWTVVLAILGLGHADKPPWAPHLREALRATAEIARTARQLIGPDSAVADSRPMLWRLVDRLPERHRVGFPGAVEDDVERACGNCAWRYRGGPGRPVDRCRQADGVRVEADWPGCNRWEAELDCRECAACCRDAYHSVTVSRRDPMLRNHPDLVVDRGSYVELRRIGHPRGNHCAALGGGIYSTDPGDARPAGDDPAGQAPWRPYGCAIYADRPRPCREFETGGQHCLTARRRVGLSR